MYRRSIRALVALLVLAVAGFLLWRALPALCGNDLLSEAESPDRTLRAFAFERGCGATTPFVRIVAIRRTADAIDFEDQESWVIVTTGQPEAALAWTGDRRLLVSLSGEHKVVRERPRWEGVDVTRR